MHPRNLLAATGVLAAVALLAAIAVAANVGLFGLTRQEEGPGKLRLVTDVSIVTTSTTAPPPDAATTAPAPTARTTPPAPPSTVAPTTLPSHDDDSGSHDDD
jgi:hypothetical protein